MKSRLRLFGLAILIVNGGLPLGGSAALATSIGNLPAAGALDLDLRRLDGAVGGPTGPNAADAALGEYLPLLDSRRLQARRPSPLSRLQFGAGSLIGFMIDLDRTSKIGISVRFSFRPRQSANWMQFWTNIAVSPETEQWFDYRAIAQAAYTPEIRYWLEGNRWASFDTALPRREAAAGGAVQAGAGAGAGAGPRAGPYSAVGQINYAAGNNPAAAKQKSGPIKIKTFREFLVSIGSKIIRQPIVYVILLVCLAILFARRRGRPVT